MPPNELSGPDLDGVVADANAVGLPYVVIGGFSVIAHGYLRATKDTDILVPDGPDADEAILRFLEKVDASRLHDGKDLVIDEITGTHQLRVRSRHGIIDIMRGRKAERASSRNLTHPVQRAKPQHLSMRLADRPQDRLDLENLEKVNGKLPIDPLPGLDT